MLDGNRDGCPEVKAGLCEREGRDRKKREGEREERQQGWRTVTALCTPQTLSHLILRVLGSKDQTEP